MTKKEQKREAKFNKTLEKLSRDGYKIVEKTIGMVQANVISTALCIPFIALFVYLYYLKNGPTWIDMNRISYFYMIFIIIAAIIVHEFIHGLFMGIFAGWKWDDVEFGFSVRTLSPYCTSQAPMSIGRYVVTLLMPTIILGFTPAIISIFIGSSVFFISSMFMILGGGGDFLITFILLTYHKSSKKIFIIDHPTKCGFYAFERSVT